MKKVMLFIAAFLAAIPVFSQVSTFPTRIGDKATGIHVFRESPLPITLIFPPSYTIPTPVKAILFSGTVVSDSVTATISGDTVKLVIPTLKIKALGKKPNLAIRFAGNYLLGDDLDIDMRYDVPNGIIRSVTIPGIGSVRVSMLGDAATAINAAATAANQAAIAVSARDSAERILDSARIYTSQATRSGTASVLRSSPAGTKKFELAEGLRSGAFYPDPTDTTSPDDSSMVIIQSGGMRYKRETHGFILAEWFGANPKDGSSDRVAIQKALNYIGRVGGGDLQLQNGVYIIDDKLVFKRTPDLETYKIRFTGKGKGTTRLDGTSGLTGKTMIDISYQPGDHTGDYNSYIEFGDMTINGPYADTVIYMDKIVDIKIKNLIVGGGVDINTHIGRTFAALIEGCYFNAGTWNGGHSLKLLSVLTIYAKVYMCSFDGAGYGIYSSGASQDLLMNNIEGSKISSIHMTSAGGGNNLLIGNALRPYAGYEPNGRLTGLMSGLYIEGISGGVAHNVISGNNIYMPAPSDLPTILVLGTASGNFTSNSSNVGYRVTGGTSGATAQVTGYNSAAKRITLVDVIGGPFQVGETITQATSGITGTVSSISTKATYGVNLITSAGNVVSGNQLIGNPGYAIRNMSNSTTISGNFIETSLGGIYNGGIANVTGNTILATTTAFEDATQVVDWIGNSYTGALIGRAPQMNSRVTTTQRDALTSTQRYQGLVLFDTTVNKLTYWNGSAWKYATETP